MEENEEVKVYGTWSSPYSKRVELALRLKGIPYKYIEEDLSNKSQSLLLHNPVHKKVPVLVHNTKPISESLVILQYIDDNWKKAPKMLPEDPYERSRARFWADFYDRHVASVTGRMIRSVGDEQKAAAEVLAERLCLIEKFCFGGDFAGRSPFLHGETPGFLDIVMGMGICNWPALEQVLGCVAIEPGKHPMICSWAEGMKNHPLVKEMLPPHDRFMQRIKTLRDIALSQAKP